MDREELTENTNTLNSLIDHLPGIVYRCLPDEVRRPVFISDTAKTLTGYEPSKLAEIGLTTLVHPDDDERVRHQVRAAMEGCSSLKK